MGVERVGVDVINFLFHVCDFYLHFAFYSLCVLREGKFTLYFLLLISFRYQNGATLGLAV